MNETVYGGRLTVDGQKKQYEDLNPKSQIPNNKQYPNSKFQFPKRKLLAIAFSSFWSLGHWNLEFIWNLVLGIRMTVDGQKKQYEDLNSKSQIPNHKQNPSSKFQFPKRKLLPMPFSSFGSFGDWNLEFIWNLVLGIWNLSPTNTFFLMPFSFGSFGKS